MKKSGDQRVHKIHLSEEEVYILVIQELEVRLDITHVLILPIIDKDIKYKVSYRYFNNGIWDEDYFVLKMDDFVKLLKIGLHKKYRKILVDVIVKPTKIKYNIYYRGLNKDYKGMIRVLERDN